MIHAQDLIQDIMSFDKDLIHGSMNLNRDLIYNLISNFHLRCKISGQNCFKELELVSSIFSQIL